MAALLMTAPVRRRLGAAPPDLVGLYLTDVGSHPLLSRAEVDALARKVRTGQAAAAAALEGASPDRQRDFEACMVEGQAAAAALVRANLRLVVSIARRYRNAGVILPDLIQEGNLGLLRAVQRYDPDRGCTFSTYATWWIRAAMAAAVSKSATGPRHAQDHGGTGRNRPSPARLDLVSLSGPAGERERTLEEVLPDHNAPSPAERAAAAGLRDAVASLLEVLDQRERAVLVWHFGLDRDPPRTLGQIAGLLGVSEERARQIKVAALAKLGRPGRRRQAALELLAG